MAASLPCLLLLLFSLAIPSGANYCVCNSGLSDSVLQKAMDYACGNGGDCSAIQSNGACFNPNTVKDHCSYAVNSYYQKKGQTSGSCDFQGTATVTTTAPSGGSGCAFQSNPSPGGTAPTPPGAGGLTTPPASPGTGGTPTSPITGGAPPSTGGGTTTPPTNPTTGGGVTSPVTGGTPTAGNAASPGAFPGTTIPGGGGLGPTGSSFDNSGGVDLTCASTTVTLVALFYIALLGSGLICP